MSATIRRSFSPSTGQMTITAVPDHLVPRLERDRLAPGDAKAFKWHCGERRAELEYFVREAENAELASKGYAPDGRPLR